MLDVNLGNKTLVIGVLIALILSYGMVNFDSGSSVSRHEGSGIRTAYKPADQSTEKFANANIAPEGIPAEELGVPATESVDKPVAESTDHKSSMSIRERRQLDLL